MTKVGMGASGIALAFGLAGALQAQTADTGAPPSTGVGEIIVTAQKRAQSLNDVPVTMTVTTGSELVSKGISSTADLAKIVPGFSAQPSPINTPVYTMRGVGFFDYSLAATPTVAIYDDEVPLPFGAMTKAAGLDVERVEVLKGPQGTLFGQNTTGGAINYIAAKPTNTFKAGADLSYGRFNSADVQGFVSGPISDTLTGRVAVRHVMGGDWQVDPVGGRTIGATLTTQGRILLDWKPSSRLKFELNLNGWLDKSDSQAPQRVATFASSPGNPNADINANLGPLSKLTDRTADWSDTGDFGTKILPMRHNDYFAQSALRVDYDVTDDVKLTSISAYEHYKTDSFQDFDGSSRNIADLHSKGKIDTVSQELRLSGKFGGLNWTVGGNYEHDTVHDAYMFYAQDSSTNYVAGLRGGPVIAINDQKIKTAAVFGNAEYALTSRLSLLAGIRYTDRRDFQFRAGNFGEAAPFLGERNLDPSIYSFARVFSFLETILPPVVTNPITLAPTDNIVFQPDGYPFVVPIQQHLNETNVSWRAGLDYKTRNRGLIYATVSKGYKAGSFPTTGGATLREYEPVKQESVLAYEVGFKQPISRGLQINGAAFYYDYKDKQLRGRVLNPVFGPLDALVQIPKSRVWGLEGQVIAQPVRGLNLSAAATYVNSKIQRFIGYNQAGQQADYSGYRFPFSPKLSVVTDAEYDWALGERLTAFLGGSTTTNSATTASVGDIPQLAIKHYTLVDLRAGIKAHDDRWRFSVWGRNVFNTYYWLSANQSQDTFVRFAGKPATYGLSVSFRY
jgi:iron complex outermembrane recepter protein